MVSNEVYEIGLRYEASLTPQQRGLGAHFTPVEVAESIVRQSLAQWGRFRTEPRAPVICDPTCGGGVFLVAAADHLAAQGYDARQIVEDLLVGMDLDPGAVQATVTALRRWAEEHGAAGPVNSRVTVGDALLDDLPLPDGVGVDIVAGNPPFQNQLETSTARTADRRSELSARFGDLASGYVDLASLVLCRSVDLVSDGGVVSLILPRSILVARDSERVRRHVLGAGDMVSMWIPDRQLFLAKVWVCIPTIRVDRSLDPERASTSGTTVAVRSGPVGEVECGMVSTTELAAAATWSPMWAVSQGVPPVVGRPNHTGGAATVGEIARSTAGFRDQYYGLLGHLRSERPAVPKGDVGSMAPARVVTTAMVDPAYIGWGHDEARIAKQLWRTPWLDRAGLGAEDARLGDWVDRLMVPKVVVSTQTKVIEAAADRDGDLVPLTPVIAVVPTADFGAEMIEAALLAPAATAWALRRFGGGGLSATSLKLAARQVAEIPLPRNLDAWREAARQLSLGPAAPARRTRAQWVEVGAMLNASWGIDDDHLVEWWVHRLGKRGLHWPATS